MRIASVCVMGLVSTGLLVSGQERPAGTSGTLPAKEPVLERFLATAEGPQFRYRALRKLNAQAGERKATLTAWTSYDPDAGFTYQIVDEQGHGMIRSKVLKAALEAERSAKQQAQRSRASLTEVNYAFDAPVTTDDGLQRVRIHPRRKEQMMIDGNILLTPGEGDLVRVEGLLVKRPSFWTRRVEVTRNYIRISGVRVPISMTSVADVLFVGRSTFEMHYEYETVNGQPVPPSRTETVAPARQALSKN